MTWLLLGRAGAVRLLLVLDRGEHEPVPPGLLRRDRAAGLVEIRVEAALHPVLRSQLAHAEADDAARVNDHGRELGERARPIRVVDHAERAGLRALEEDELLAVVDVVDEDRAGVARDVGTPGGLVRVGLEDLRLRILDPPQALLGGILDPQHLGQVRVVVDDEQVVDRQRFLELAVAGAAGVDLVQERLELDGRRLVEEDVGGLWSSLISLSRLAHLHSSRGVLPDVK